MVWKAAGCHNGFPSLQSGSGSGMPVWSFPYDFLFVFEPLYIWFLTKIVLYNFLNPGYWMFGHTFLYLQGKDYQVQEIFLNIVSVWAILCLGCLKTPGYINQHYVPFVIVLWVTICTVTQIPRWLESGTLTSLLVTICDSYHRVIVLTPVTYVNLFSPD